jgi:spore maturation protein B
MEEGRTVALISALLVPLVLLGAAVWGMVKGVDVYDGLVTGAREGLSVLLHIFPALLVMLVCISLLRASGFLDWAEALLEPILEQVGIPAETVPILLLRPFSGSGALGVGAELIQTYGPDSTIGRTAAVMLGSTETTFYTIAVYFGGLGIRKTRYAVPAAICADLAGFWAAAWAVRLFFGG